MGAVMAQGEGRVLPLRRATSSRAHDFRALRSPLPPARRAGGLVGRRPRDSRRSGAGLLRRPTTRASGTDEVGVTPCARDVTRPLPWRHGRLVGWLCLPPKGRASSTVIVWGGLSSSGVLHRLDSPDVSSESA